MLPGSIGIESLPDEGKHTISVAVLMMISIWGKFS